MLTNSGKPESAYDLRWLPPAEKARIALARLNAAGITGERLLEIALTVASFIYDRGPSDYEFRDVQIAKVAHRLASGTHRTTSGIPMRSKYAPSTGKVLRILGHRIWDLAAIAAGEDALFEITQAARPNIAKAEKAEAKRQSEYRVRRKTEEAIARQIKRARDYGMGPQSLAEMERTLRAKYGLK